MKATGIVRCIDDLGRVVIPKEIRRALKINEGDPLEIYVDHEQHSVILIPQNPCDFKSIEDLLEDSETPEDAKTLLRIAQKMIMNKEKN